MSEKMKIRPTGIIKVADIGTAHIPKDIRDELRSSEIPYVLNANVALLFNPNISPEDILKSLKVLMQDVELRIENQSKR